MLSKNVRNQIVAATGCSLTGVILLIFVEGSMFFGDFFSWALIGFGLGWGLAIFEKNRGTKGS